MHVAFLHSKTGLIVTVNAATGLADKILFTFNSIHCVPFLESHGSALLSTDLFMKLVDSVHWGRKDGFVSTRH